MFKNNRKFVICGVYTPPRSQTEVYQSLTINIDSILETYLDYNLICMGNFVSLKVNRVIEQSKSNYYYRGDKGEKLIDHT